MELEEWIRSMEKIFVVIEVPEEEGNHWDISFYWGSRHLVEHCEGQIHRP